MNANIIIRRTNGAYIATCSQCSWMRTGFSSERGAALIANEHQDADHPVIEQPTVEAIEAAVEADAVAADIASCNGIGDVTHPFLPAHSHGDAEATHEALTAHNREMCALFGGHTWSSEGADSVRDAYCIACLMTIAEQAKLDGGWVESCGTCEQPTIQTDDAPDRGAPFCSKACADEWKATSARIKAADEERWARQHPSIERRAIGRAAGRHL